MKNHLYLTTLFLAVALLACEKQDNNPTSSLPVRFYTDTCNAGGFPEQPQDCVPHYITYYTNGNIYGKDSFAYNADGQLSEYYYFSMSTPRHLRMTVDYTYNAGCSAIEATYKVYGFVSPDPYILTYKYYYGSKQMLQYVFNPGSPSSVYHQRGYEGNLPTTYRTLGPFGNILGQLHLDEQGNLLSETRDYKDGKLITPADQREYTYATSARNPFYGMPLTHYNHDVWQNWFGPSLCSAYKSLEFQFENEIYLNSYNLPDSIYQERPNTYGTGIAIAYLCQ